MGPVLNDVASHDELLAAVARGDQRAFARLYDRVAPAVHGVVRAIVRDPAEAEEVATAVLVELWRTAARYSPDSGGVIAWATATAHRRAVDRLRSTRRLPAPVPPGVRKGLDGLSESDRRAVGLAFFDGRTYHQVAETLTVAPGAARHQLRDGLRRLGKCQR